VPEADALAAYAESGIDRLLVLARPLADGLGGHVPDAVERFATNTSTLAECAGLA
jgi:hypothetical protein